MEIDIQHEKRTVWPWLIAGLVALGLVAWWAFGRGKPAPLVAADTSNAVIADAGTAALPTAVDVYLRFADSARGADVTTVDHGFAASGIRHLASALEAVAAPGGANIAGELTTLRQEADALQQNPRSTEHADHARKAFISLAGLMKAVQLKSFPQLDADVASVSDAAESVAANRPLMEQGAAIQTFFDRAAAAVRRMSGSGS